MPHDYAQQTPRRSQGCRTRHPHRWPVRLAYLCRIRRRGDQGRIARWRRPVAQMAQAVRGHLAVVVRAGSQQAVAHPQPQTPRGPRDSQAPAGRGRHPDRELPPGRAGKTRPGLGRAARAQPAPGNGAPVGLRPDRADEGPAGLRRRGRVDGRPALHHRLRRPPTGAHGYFHR